MEEFIEGEEYDRNKLYKILKEKIKMLFYKRACLCFSLLTTGELGGGLRVLHHPCLPCHLSCCLLPHRAACPGSVYKPPVDFQFV